MTSLAQSARIMAAVEREARLRWWSGEVDSFGKRVDDYFARLDASAARIDAALADYRSTTQDDGAVR